MFKAKQKSPTPAAPPALSPEQKDAARACLHNADKLLKEGDFEKAKVQINKAKELDPSNAYIYAFQDRIEYFEELKKKEASAPKFTPAPPPKVEVKPTPPKVEIKPTPPPSPPPAPPNIEEESAPPPAPPAPKFTPPPEPEPPKTPIYQMPQPVQPVQPEPPPVKAPPVVPVAEHTPRIQSSQNSTPVYEEPRAARQEADSMLMEMKRQIEELNRALQEEKKARETMSSQQMQAAAKQFRTSLEKAWMNGAPPAKEAQELHNVAMSLGISDELEHSISREVKLEMYSRAVKEMISKRKLLKSSSSTMEWLRKVYQISITEYLENESKFLMDLVADQFKGTLLFVTSDPDTKNSLIPKLKMAGFAVVLVPNPESALEKIEKINPNIIMCEAEFPDASLSGVKFLHVLRVNSKFNFLPFVMLCDTKNNQQVQSSELKPNEGLVTKPIDFDELSTLMNEKMSQFREYISSL